MPLAPSFYQSITPSVSSPQRMSSAVASVVVRAFHVEADVRGPVAHEELRLRGAEAQSQPGRRRRRLERRRDWMEQKVPSGND